MPAPDVLTADDVLEAVRERDREEHPVLSTAEIVDRVDASRPTVKDRLDVLLDEERIKVKSASNAKLYWPADERAPTAGDGTGGNPDGEPDIRASGGPPAESSDEKVLETTRKIREGQVEQKRRIEKLEEAVAGSQALRLEQPPSLDERVRSLRWRLVQLASLAGIGLILLFAGELAIMLGLGPTGTSFFLMTPEVVVATLFVGISALVATVLLSLAIRVGVVSRVDPHYQRLRNRLGVNPQPQVSNTPDTDSG